MWHDTYLRFHDETDYLATMPPALRWVGPQGSTLHTRWRPVAPLV
jgi:hypothetical protein